MRSVENSRVHVMSACVHESGVMKGSISPMIYSRRYILLMVAELATLLIVNRMPLICRCDHSYYCERFRIPRVFRFSHIWQEVP